MGPTAGPAAGPGIDGEAIFYVIGWVFFNAHFVDIAAAGQSVNLLSVFGGFTTIPTLVYYAVPALLLLATGRNVAKKARSGASDGERAAAGVTVLAGYLPLAVVASFVLTLEVGALGTTGSIGPDTGSALLFAGIAYPLVFGGLGGYLAD